MAKMRQVVGSAVLEVEGDAEAVRQASLQFHRALAELALRDIEDKLASLRPLQKQRRAIQKQIAELKSESAKPIPAPAPPEE
jgi:hypothetical protein